MAVKPMAVKPFALGLLSMLLAPVLLTPAAIALEFPPPAQSGAGSGSPSSGTSGGGTRGSSACITQEDGLSLMALQPIDRKNYIGKTAQKSPTLFFYIPSTTAQRAEFILVDGEGNDVYTENLEISKEGGLVSIDVELPELPSDLKSVEYTWQLILVCNRSDRGADEWVEGQIQQVTLDPELATKLEAEENPVEQAQLLADAEIWYDSLAIAAQVRTLNPQSWTSLLKSVGLGKLSETEILPFQRLTESP
ncbi:DUF928 domain-containing protein [Roseofilum casamattae]|uniref:DUF928 domain-containing protein n=1 Tax=Roseofilum casamattae BLCC-M143 TaxID=3022442 RepID=A0ABT7BXG5_9CYAN|nr:DUF928 domain-containing protein [Roseofilum casamattae]MDJ1183879.1 DUF928 domain-containing protein [Roseofilum casamattae BLCC-M143]